MKASLGVFMIIVGIIAGLFVGGYLCFYGGIVSVINGFQADPVSAGKIALGVLRVIMSSFCGYASALMLIVPGVVLIKNE